MSRTAARRKSRKGGTAPVRMGRMQLAVAIVLPLLGLGLGIWLIGHKSSASMEDSTVAVGMSVQSFQLPDLVSGKQFDAADYIGKQDLVLVSYMGWFCPGCQQLLVELQERQADFSKRGAKLVVLGSKPESETLVRSQITKYGITVPILYDAGTTATKQVGLWSEMMQMPWMGYLIIDKSGRVAASNLQMSEASGAAPSNVNEIVSALDRVQPN